MLNPRYLYLIHFDGRASRPVVIESLGFVPASLLLFHEYLCECAECLVFFETEVSGHLFLFLRRIDNRSIACENAVAPVLVQDIHGGARRALPPHTRKTLG